MNTYFDSKFQKQIYSISPGEYYCSKENILISTVLGSCISILMYDAENVIGGMNHFMLASTSKEFTISCEQAGRFGEYSMELLLNEMLKKGASRKNIKAKIFGGANVFNTAETSSVQVGCDNIFFAFNYLETEKIPIINSDTGGTEARKIFFDPLTNKVWLKRIKNSMNTAQSIQIKEKDYVKSIITKEEKTGDIVWF